MLGLEIIHLNFRNMCSDNGSVSCRYTAVLADNIDGGDDLDLIVTTMNGNVFCFSTPSPHHPLKVWHFQMLNSAFLVCLLIYQSFPYLYVVAYFETISFP